MQLEFQTITPEQASDLLTNHNPNNRRLDVNHSLFLAKEMERGTFRPDNGDSIRIDVDGNVLDGQHRLAAIVKVGKPVTMLIAKDVDREAFATIDTGKRRTVGDIVRIDLACDGISVPYGATRAASLLVNYEARFDSGTAITGDGGWRRAWGTPVNVVRETCRRPGFLSAVERGSKIAKRMDTAMVSSVAVALIACERDSKAMSDLYFHRLLTLEGMAHGAPELAVMKSLTTWRINGTAVQRTAYAQLFALIRGYMASRDGETLNFIRLPKTPENFPYMPTK